MSGYLLSLLLVAIPAASLADPGRLDEALKRLSPMEADEILWLARNIYSESDRPHEQELVAWVVRNRVETQYRGSGYRDVTLMPYQFSAFNHDTPRRRYLFNLNFDTELKSWRRALEIALKVYRAPDSQRPFPQTVRHFYSPISMTGRDMPVWAEGQTALSARELGVSPIRFQFFDNIDEPALASSESTGEKGQQVSEGYPFRHIRRTGSRIRERMGTSGVPRPARPGMVQRTGGNR